MLFGKKKNKKAPAPKSLPLDFEVPKKDIKFIRTFTQADSFKGFRSVRISADTSKVVENNIDFFRDNGYDFTNCTVQLQAIKCDIDPGVKLKVVVDGRFIGNIYRGKGNAEAFNAVMDNEVDKAYIKIEDAYIDGKYYGTQGFIMLHWPNMGPKVNVTVK